MLKRMVLAITFVGAMAVGGSAMAWHDCRGPVATYPYPTYAGYAGYAPYRPVAPRVAYYPAPPVRSYPVFYGAYDRPHHHRRNNSGVTISFGF